MEKFISTMGSSHYKKLQSSKENTFDSLVSTHFYTHSDVDYSNIRDVLKTWLYDMEYVSEWESVYRVLKPGAYGVVFSGRTFQDVVTISLRLVGFEIKNVIMWIHGVEDRSEYEPIILIQKPISEDTIAKNVVKWGCGAINIDGCRIETTDKLTGGAVNGSFSVSHDGWDRPWRHNSNVIERKSEEVRVKVEKAQRLGRFPADIILDDFTGKILDQQSGERKGWSGQNHSGFNPYGGTSFHKSSTEREGYHEGYNDTGGASRFFLSTGCGKDGLNDILIPYLTKLVTPVGGKVLDLV